MIWKLVYNEFVIRIRLYILRIIFSSIFNYKRLCPCVCLCVCKSHNFVSSPNSLIGWQNWTFKFKITLSENDYCSIFPFFHKYLEFLSSSNALYGPLSEDQPFLGAPCMYWWVPWNIYSPKNSATNSRMYLFWILSWQQWPLDRLVAIL